MIDKVDGVTYKDTNLDRQFFLDTLTEFNEKLGQKDFWLDEKAQDIAREALVQDYFRTNHKGYKLSDARALQVALNEYHMRHIFMQRYNNGLLKNKFYGEK